MNRRTTLATTLTTSLMLAALAFTACDDSNITSDVTTEVDAATEVDATDDLPVEIALSPVLNPSAHAPVPQATTEPTPQADRDKLTIRHASETTAQVEYRKADGDWIALKSAPSAPGIELADIAELRTLGGPAVLMLDGPSGRASVRGKLWLQAYTKVGVAAAGKHALVVDSIVGQARLSLWGERTFAALRTSSGVVSLERRDVLLGQKRDGIAATATADNPAAADWTVDLDVAAEPSGIGTLETRDPAGAIALLTLNRLDIRATVAGDMVATTVEHTFHNPTEETLEGTFRFPLPEGAALTGLAMMIGGSWMDGELVERAKARKIYDDIVDNMQDPAILEWEKGQVFKLRVFPIEPQSDKRVRLTYLAPATRSPKGLTFRYPTASDSSKPTPIARVTVALDGASILDEANFMPGRAIEHVLPEAPPAVQIETGEDGTYYAVRLEPDWPTSARTRDATPRDLVIVVDTSRSALESYALSQQALAHVLGTLRDGDRFRLLSADIDVRHHDDDFQAPTKSAIGEATQALADIEPDGASDLGKALGAAASTAGVGRKGATQVLYIGDGTATWGDDRPESLIAASVKALLAAGDVPFHALVLGQRAETGTVASIAAPTNGFVGRAHNQRAVARFGLRLSQGLHGARLTALEAAAYDGVEVLGLSDNALFRGDTAIALVRVTKGSTAPKTMAFSGLVGGKRYREQVRLDAPTPTAHIAKRWARAKIGALQSAGAEREDVLKVSMDHGVMSKYTAFLVLESEEAYKQHNIKRRKKAKAKASKDADLADAGDHEALRISGADLESLGASLSQDEMQPGDPEVYVPAPKDAKSVTVVFPFGETKQAVWEPSLKLWMCRFLIDNETPDGEYAIRVRITHADDRVEMLDLTYRVDTHPGDIELGLSTVVGKPGTFRVHVRQKLTQRDFARAGVTSKAPLSVLSKRYAHILKDLERVDLRLPDGKEVRMVPHGKGRMRKLWTPKAAMAGSATFRTVTYDDAGNHATREFTVDLTTAGTKVQWGSHE